MQRYSNGPSGPQPTRAAEDGALGRAGLAARAGRNALVWALGSLAVAILASLSSPARALTVDEVTPLFFEGAGGFGFDLDAADVAGRTAAFRATAADQWIAAPGSTLTVAQRIGAVHQLPAAVSELDPAIVDSTWTVTNTGAGDLIAPLLVFTSLDPLNTYSGDGPKPRQGLDADLLELLAYSYAGTDYLFGAAQLPDLAEGESAEFTLRYIVASTLQTRATSQLLAPMGVSLLGSYRTVPEPSTLVLLSLGLTITTTWGFRRRRSSKRPGGSAGGGSIPS